MWKSLSKGRKFYENRRKFSKKVSLRVTFSLKFGLSKGRFSEVRSAHTRHSPTLVPPPPREPVIKPFLIGEMSIRGKFRQGKVCGGNVRSGKIPVTVGEKSVGEASSHRVTIFCSKIHLAFTYSAFTLTWLMSFLQTPVKHTISIVFDGWKKRNPLESH